MKTAKHIGVKLEHSYLEMLEELQVSLQAKTPISIVSRSDVMKYAIAQLYQADKAWKKEISRKTEWNEGKNDNIQSSEDHSTKL